MLGASFGHPPQTSRRGPDTDAPIEGRGAVGGPGGGDHAELSAATKPDATHSKDHAFPFAGPGRSRGSGGVRRHTVQREELMRHHMVLTRWAGRVALVVGAPTVVAIVLATTGVVGAQSQRDAAVLFRMVFRTVATDAVDSLSDDALYEKAARGLVHALNDPYAALYSPAELAEVRRNQFGDRYSGLGMSVEDQAGAMTVIAVFPGGPAALAGIAPGDRIRAINAEAIAGWTADQVTDHLTGSPGSTVDVTVMRAGVGTPIQNRLTRASVRAPAVPYTLMLETGIGYIPLRQFNASATNDVRIAIVSLRGAGATAFVLDLRGNGGGQLDEALGITNLFLDSGTTLVTIRDRARGTETATAQQRPLSLREPLVVLIDRNTASASEIVAGALQDHDRAVVVGVPSFGKGLVQTTYPLDGGWAVKMTTGRWFTPRGRSIHRVRRFVDGHFVGTDSEARRPTAAAAHAGRPTVTSDDGRVLYGGGGIVPDVVVPGDTLLEADRLLAAALAPYGRVAHVALYDIARDLMTRVSPTFVVQPAWRDTLYRHLVADSVHVDRAVFDAGRALIDRLIETKVAELAFGDSSAFRGASMHDASLRRALGLLRQASSVASLLRIAQDDG
jgi:carboxyl-terminal processing protease